MSYYRVCPLCLPRWEAPVFLGGKGQKGTERERDGQKGSREGGGIMTDKKAKALAALKYGTQ